MVENYRCNQYREDAIEEQKPKIAKLIELCRTKAVEDFKEQCNEILDGSANFFTSKAHKYSQAAQTRNQDELKEALMLQLYQAFEVQVKFCRDYQNDKVLTETKKLEQKPLEEIAEILSSVLNTLFKSNLDSYERKLNNITLDGSGWQDKVSLQV